MARFLAALRSVNVEPLCFVWALGYSMMDVTRQDLLYQVISSVERKGTQARNYPVIQTACMNNYGVAGSNCSELVKANTSMKHDIERTTTYYLQACTLVESILPSIFCLFVGPWTDEHGRKWPIVSNYQTNHCLNWILSTNLKHPRLQDVLVLLSLHPIILSSPFYLAQNFGTS